MAISVRLDHRDLGSAMAEITATLSQDERLPTGVLEFGGLFQQQQKSFQNLFVVLAADLGLLPLAYGIGAGSDMLQPLAICVIGALTLSVLFSLVATPTLYFVMRTLVRRKGTMACVS